jgi:putative chitinase
MTESPNPNLDAQHAQLDLEIKQTELGIKQAELKTKLNEASKVPPTAPAPPPPPPKPSAPSPLTLAVITGIIGLIGAGVANVLQTRSNLQLERQKFESSLMLKAIETGKPELAAKNLLFLVKVGLINDASGKIASLETNPEDAPVLPVAPGAVVPVPRTASAAQAFFEKYGEQFEPLSDDGKAVLTKLFSVIEKDKTMTDVRLVAYTLATIKWETANTFKPTTETGSDEELENRYGPATDIGRRLGNTEAGDGARYKGRGYVQLNGKRNYSRINDTLGLAGTDSDLVKHPERVMDPEIGYRVAGAMMSQGLVTGKKLGDFINNQNTDYTNARKIINGLDHAAEVAASAKKFEQILRESVNKSN